MSSKSLQVTFGPAAANSSLRVWLRERPPSPSQSRRKDDEGHDDDSDERSADDASKARVIARILQDWVRLLLTLVRTAS